MKITGVDELALCDVRLIRYARFRDHRGYFTEHCRQSDMFAGPETPFLHGFEVVQMNESYSRAGTIRGLHFQWDPYVGKLVRVLSGHLLDLVLDIRVGSPAYGKIVGVDLPADTEASEGRWLWVPPGFAHGIVCLADTTIEYLCTGTYNPRCEASISPLAEDLDWSLCAPGLRAEFAAVVRDGPLMSDKDRHAPSLTAWAQSQHADAFVFAEVARHV